MTKYSEDHEWIAIDGDTGTVGITNFAQGALGDVVFVELPEVGTTYAKGDEAAVVESVKAASEIYMPVSGEIIAINDALEADPSLVNSSAEDGGWFFKVKMSDAGELEGLMDADGYKAFAAEQD